MILDTENIVLVGSILLFVSIIASKFSSKLGTPTLLLFLVVGMIFGSDGVGIQFDSPAVAQFIGMIALSIILFSGGMDTKTDDIKPVAFEGITLATIGVLLTAGITGVIIYYITQFIGINFSFLESLLLASIMSSTDSASVFSIFSTKKQGLKENLRPLLELESGSNDPMAYILTIVLIGMISSGDMNFGEAVLKFFTQMIVGALSGYLLGRLTVISINRINLKNKSLYSILLLALVFFVFAFTDFIGGNGYLAVYLAGLVVGNNKIYNKRTLVSFFDGVAWLFQIVMFLTLGLLVNPHELWDVTLLGIIIAIIMIFISRPIAIFASLAPFRKLSLKARTYVSWVGLRGAVPIIFATYPMVEGLENANIMFNVVFLITIISLVMQGTTVTWFANILGLSTKEVEKGFDIALPDEVKAKLTELKVTEEFLVKGNTLRDINLPKDILVMMIRRGDKYIVPRGDTQIILNDILLFIKEDARDDSEYLKTLEIKRLFKGGK
ncbi:MAG: potassium/proton antiporter [Bacteroidales bacterium]|nr:potassium/proton antiporter [Bacteroidales bacterium]